MATVQVQLPLPPLMHNRYKNLSGLINARPELGWYLGCHFPCIFIQREYYLVLLKAAQLSGRATGAHGTAPGHPGVRPGQPGRTISVAQSRGERTSYLAEPVRGRGGSRSRGRSCSRSRSRSRSARRLAHSCGPSMHVHGGSRSRSRSRGRSTQGRSRGSPSRSAGLSPAMLGRQGYSMADLAVYSMQGAKANKKKSRGGKKEKQRKQNKEMRLRLLQAASTEFKGSLPAAQRRSRSRGRSGSPGLLQAWGPGYRARSRSSLGR